MNEDLTQLAEELATLDLTARQVRTLMASLTAESIDEVCEQSGIGRSTYYRWRNESAAFRRGIALVRRTFFGIVLAEAKAEWMKRLFRPGAA